MSFSSDVKKEIGNINASDCCLKAELYSIIRYKATIKISSKGLGMTVDTTLNVVARRIIFLFKKIYDCDLTITAFQKQKLDYKTKYVLEVTDKTLFIFKDLKILNDDNSINEQINYDILKRDCCKASLIRGLFLVQGSVNNPATSNYHLEIVLSENTDVPYIIKILETVGINAKSIERKKGFVLYLKKSEQIGDFLKFIGAVNSLFYFEDQRIKRDYNNSVNRVMNCDIANEEKAISSANKQLENIKFLTDSKGIVNLTERICNAIILRTTFPDASLSELSDNSFDVVGKYISKSGLSHCYRDIEIMCNEIKGKKRK